MRTTAIIIPCFNEEMRLQADAFTDNVNKHPWLHFIFVNDGSTDNTGASIKNLTALHANQMHYLDLKDNSGKATAVWHGFQKAFSMGYDNIGYWDADLATPLSAIAQMSTQLSAPEIVMVFGSRVRLLHRQIERNTIRHYLGRLFATVTSLVLGITVYDTQCGAKIFKNNENLRQVFKKPFSTKWIFDVEIFVRFILLHKHNGVASIANTAIEHPLQKWQDVPGSKLSLWDFFTATYELSIIALQLHGPKSLSHYKKI